MFSLFFKKSCAAQVDAEALNLSRLDSENALERVEGHIQLAIIYRQQYKNTRNRDDIAKAIEHGRSAVVESQKAGNMLLSYDARVCVMQAWQEVEEYGQATQIAEEIIHEMGHPNSGANLFHREAAEKIIAVNKAPSFT